MKWQGFFKYKKDAKSKSIFSSIWWRVTLAAILSGFVWPGLGQIYNGEFRQGLILIGLYFLLLLSFLQIAQPGLESLTQNESENFNMESFKLIMERISEEKPTFFFILNLVLTSVWLYAWICAAYDAYFSGIKLPSKNPPSDNTSQ